MKRPELKRQAQEWAGIRQGPSKGTLSNKNATDLVCSALFSLLRYTIPLNTHWQPIGDKESHANDLSKITRVPEAVFRDGLTSNRPCVAQIILWVPIGRLREVKTELICY